MSTTELFRRSLSDTSINRTVPLWSIVVDWIVAMGVSAETLSPKCDTSERARLRAVLIMIVNNNRAHHRHLPDVTRALHRLDARHRHHPRATRRPGRRERLSINHKHAHVRDWHLIPVARLQFIIRIGRSSLPVRGFDRPDFINTWRQGKRSSKRAPASTHMGSPPPGIVMVIIRISRTFARRRLRSVLIYNPRAEASHVIDNISGSRR